MTEQPIKTYEEEISLLDILVTLAESWKLLVFGPLIAGVLAGGLSFFLPKTFESVSVVRMSEAELSLLGAAPVLDPLIEKFGLLAEFDGIQNDARQYLAKKIVGKSDKKNGLVTIVATANTPERAQELGRAAIDALLQELVPKGKKKEQIEQQILINERIISNSTDAIELLQRQMGKVGQGDAGLELVMKHYASLSMEVAKKELENFELKKSLVIYGDELYVQKPTLPQAKTTPKSSSLILQAMLGAVVTFILFVFIRKAWRTATQGDESTRKIIRIKQLLGLNDMS
jgi:phosphate/sulfate permease